MSAKKLKKIAVTIGFKADNTPIKKGILWPFNGPGKKPRRAMAGKPWHTGEAGRHTHPGWLGRPLAERVQEAGRHAHRLYDHV